MRIRRWWSAAWVAGLVAGGGACGDDDGAKDVGGDTTVVDTTVGDTNEVSETSEDTAETDTVEVDTADTGTGETDTVEGDTADTGTGETQDDTLDTGDADDGETTPVEATYSVMILAPTDGKVFSAPLGIDAAGNIAGYIAVEAWGPDARAVSVTPAGVVTVLPVENVQSGYAYGVNGTALVVGTNSFVPSVWVDGVESTLKVPDGWFSGSAQGVNASGFIVGSWADSDDALPPNPVGPRPVTWASPTASPVPLPTFAAAEPLGIAFDVNDTGIIAGTLATTTNGFAAVRWAGATAEPDLVTLTGTTLAEAKAINAAGDVAGRATLTDQTSRAFRARVGLDGVLLPPLVVAEPYAEGHDIDDAGQVVGASRFAAGVLHATLWSTEGVAVDLNDRLAEALPEGAEYLASAVAITPDGSIIACEVVLDEGFGDSVRRIAILKVVAP